MRAHAPGSVTTMFVPVDGGAHGVSFATEDGVVADVTSAEATAVTLDGEATGFEPVELALEALGVTARVDLTAEVPVGRGFGASGAATLATVLAADATFALGRAREDLVEVAADAEIAAGTGLGDVYVQERGGLVWNVGDGRRRRDCTEAVAYASYGGIDTADVLGDDAAMARVREAGQVALADFEPDAGFRAVVGDGWRFAAATDLPTAPVQEAVGRVEAAGGVATMAMVGETVVAVGAEGVLPERTRVTPDGARLLDG
jgi:pantoate kinase